jgi:hypothetical protein
MRAALSLTARRRLPAAAAGAAAAPALARRWAPAAVALPTFRPLSTESERVHGKLDADRVGSKAMRKKLAADAAETDRAKAPVAVPEPPAPAPWPPQQQMAQWQQQQPPPQYGQPVPFGQLMKTYFLMGVGMSLAFIVVRLVLGF